MILALCIELLEKAQKSEMLDISSERDKLTGAFGRDKLFDDLKKIQLLAKFKGSNWSVLLIDIDNMKRFNLHNGHVKGDELLSQFVLLVRNVCGVHDKIYRYSGNEFVVFLENYSPNDARSLASRICDMSSSTMSVGQPENCGDPHCGGPVKMSVSIGMVLNPENYTSGSLIECAQTKIYKIKESGGNGILY